MRVEGWESLLNEHISQAYQTPFSWGEHDCALWSASWVAKCTGADHTPPWRGKYKTAIGASRFMKRRGFDGVAGIAAVHLPEIRVAMARRGDLVLLEQTGSTSLGVCNGRDSFFLTADGVTLFPTLGCARAWRV